jgi:hypothetical protein
MKRKYWALFLLSLFLSATTSAQKKEPRVMGLIEIYGLSASIVYGAEDEYAANVLLDYLKPYVRSLKTVPAKGNKPRRDDVVIYVGSFESNLPGAEAFKALGYSLNWSSLTEGSFLLKTFRKEGKTTVFVTGKDRLGTLYATYDLRNYYLRIDMGRVLLNELNIVERAQLKYRWFRSWDSRTHWDLSSPSNRMETKLTSASSPDRSFDSPEAFLRNLQRTVDFMSEHRLNGLLVWGFLRDSQGGVEAASELCSYARERGVRILPRVVVGAHGGFFYGGEHPFSFTARAKQHPELRAVDAKGNFRDHTLCPEKPENRRWFREGLGWLYENFRIGGISIEMDPFVVCHCKVCQNARRAMTGRDPDHFKDLARIVTFLAEEARKLDPQTWVSYVTHTGFDADSIRRQEGSARSEDQLGTPFPPEFLSRIPEFAICQWDLTPMLRNGTWPSPFKAAAKHNVAILQWGGVPARQESELYVKRLEEVTHHAFSCNLEGLSVYGALSPDRSNVELNYLIFSELSFNPAADLDEFFKFKLSRLYGGEESSKKLKKILELIEGEAGLVVSKFPEATQLARQGLELADRTGKDRWEGLIRYLEGYKSN